AHAADRNSLFLSPPGHGGTDEGIYAGQAEFFGEHTLSLDIPPLFDGIDLGSHTRRTQPCTWPPRLGARGGPGSSPTAPRRAIAWRPWPSPASAAASSRSAAPIRASSTASCWPGSTPPLSARTSTRPTASPTASPPKPWIGPSAAIRSPSPPAAS